MARGTTLTSLEDLASAEIEIHRTVETIDPRDENIVNNRVFVWNFERADLDEFINYFRLYRGMQVNADSRQKLNSRLNGKVNSMLNEGYIPIECMLYASKVINSRITNDHELIEILAERIRDVYLRKTDASIEVFNNILDKWSSWIPLLKIVITAIGLIGDNDELLDILFQRFSSDEQLKITVFFAFMKNKNASNLDRAMKIVMGLQENVQIDERIGRAFTKEFIKFGQLGAKALEKYRDNPGMSKLGRRIFNKIQIESGVSTDAEDSELDASYSILARNSKNDHDAYLKFLQFCEETNDKHQAAFLCRFSSADVVEDFLKDYLLDTTTKTYSREVGLISLAYLKSSGYKDAKDLIREFKDRRECRDGYLIAMMIVNDAEAIQNFVDLLTREPDHKLGKFFGLLRNATLQSSGQALTSIQQEIVNRLYTLLRGNNFQAMDVFTSNLKIFWDQRLFYLLSDTCLRNINSAIWDYTKGLIRLDENVVISLIAIGLHRYNNEFEGILFELYRSTELPKLKNFIFRSLKERDIKAPM